MAHKQGVNNGASQTNRPFDGALTLLDAKKYTASKCRVVVAGESTRSKGAPRGPSRLSNEPDRNDIEGHKGIELVVIGGYEFPVEFLS